MEYMDKRVVRSKTALKNAFLELLYEKPCGQITISEIVRAANYNRGTFYANFESKDALLDEVISDILKDMIDEIRKPYESFHTVRLREMKVEEITLFNYFKENAKVFNLLLSDHIRVDFRYKLAKAIEELFTKEYDYELQKDSHVLPKWLYIYRAHGIAGLIIRWIEEDFPESPTFMAKQIVELMVTGTEVFHVKG